MDDKTDCHGLASLNANARDLEGDLEWFAQVLDARLKAYFEPGVPGLLPSDIVPPPLEDSDSNYARFLRDHEVAAPTRLVLLLALIPHVRPQLLDILWSRNEATQRGFPEFGGLQGAGHGGFIPTGETAAFLLAGDDLAARFESMSLFEPDAFLAREGIVELSAVSTGESQLSGILTLSREALHRFTTGLDRRPGFNMDFPARRIVTELAWEDLVLPPATLGALEEIRRWVLHGETLLRDWGMRGRLSPGFTTLFHGPPGTGKTLSASLLGKHCGCDVYKIDLSMILSKYIGETEKNLAKIFDAAENKGWILFFDEADALFGKRTKVDDSHDRFANQEVSFLLQRIEAFRGVVILASNFKANIDAAFLRRFQSVVEFPMPKSTERLRIWQEAFPKTALVDGAVDFPRLAERYELSGGTILNVIRYASLVAISSETQRVSLEDIEEGIRREFLKEGRAL